MAAGEPERYAVPVPRQLSHIPDRHETIKSVLKTLQLRVAFFDG
jgi:hypothetical protein